MIKKPGTALAPGNISLKKQNCNEVKVRDQLTTSLAQQVDFGTITFSFEVEKYVVIKVSKL